MRLQTCSAGAGANEQAAAWRSLLPIFQAKPSATVSDICKSLAGLNAAARSEGATVQDIIALMRSLKRCLGESAKKALIDDLNQFADALAPFARLPVLDFADAVVVQLSQPTITRGRRTTAPRTDVIENYLRDLEAALSDEAKFLEVFNKLQKDASLKAPELKRLARDFAKAAAKTKADAFDRIWGRHASLLGAAARTKATGGRTAA